MEEKSIEEIVNKKLEGILNKRFKELEEKLDEKIENINKQLNVLEEFVLNEKKNAIDKNSTVNNLDIRLGKVELNDLKNEKRFFDIERFCHLQKLNIDSNN